MVNRKTVEFSQQTEYIPKSDRDYQEACKNPIHRYSGQLQSKFFEEVAEKEKQHLRIVKNLKPTVHIHKLNSRQKRAISSAAF
jgi:hypothetical protein